jgi:hypothetical protein
MKRIIFSRPDGGVSVVSPAPGVTIEQAMLGLPVNADKVHVVDASAIPQDRYFRDAWRLGDGCIEHDMEKCKSLHRNKIRAARAPKLAALDVEQLRGRDVEAQKQVLRDATSDPRIDAATTPDELKAVWPL